jgi:CRISPR-associated endoribonuclease Cas6
MELDNSLTPEKMMKLYSVVVELGSSKTGNPPATLGRAIYAQVLQWFHLGDPQIAETIHQSSAPPITLSGLLGYRRPSKNYAGDRFYFRIGLLNDQLIQPLLKGIEQWGQKPLLLGKYPFSICQFYFLSGTHTLARSCNYFSLAQQAATTQMIQLNFLSPTSFKQDRHIQPFPLPDLVFGSLLRRWNAFAPQELHFSPVEWQGVISAFELKTHALKLEGGAEIGSQGWVRYRFSDPEQAKIASILAQFAFYAGVGRKTTMGMGQVKVHHES